LHATAFAVPSSLSSKSAGTLQVFIADEVVQVLTIDYNHALSISLCRLRQLCGYLGGNASSVSVVLQVPLGGACQVTKWQLLIAKAASCRLL